MVDSGGWVLVPEEPRQIKEHRLNIFGIDRSTKDHTR